MSYKTLQRLPLALAALLTCLSSHADFISADGKARISGFGTVGAARTNTDEVLFNYPGQGGGVNRKVGMEPDTKIGVQGSYNFTNTFSASAQVLTKYRASGKYEPAFEWAFANWQAMPSLSVRLGRIGAPFFMISDFRDVGYANTSLRPPLDVYGLLPVSSVDGGDISYKTNVGDTVLTSTFWGGYSRADYANQRIESKPSSFTARLSGQLGWNLLAELEGGLSIRFGHVQGKLSIAVPFIDDLLQQAGAFAAGNPALVPGGVQAARDALVTSRSDVSFTGLGFTLDRDNIVLSSEYAVRRAKTGMATDSSGWYVLGGYRVGAVLPYVVFSANKVDDTNTGPATPAVLGVLSSTVAALQTTSQQAQKTTSVGVRWDVLPSAALKLQFDHVKKPANSNGLFLTGSPAHQDSQSFYKAKKHIKVISVAVDFVF